MVTGVALIVPELPSSNMGADIFALIILLLVNENKLRMTARKLMQKIKTKQKLPF
jgi:hypothetical protein